MHISKKAGAIAPSLTLEITNRAKELKAAGRDIVSFGAGEPDFPTPKWIVDAAKAALDRGETKYTAASGTMELKKAVCDKFRRDNGLKYTPDQIVISNGAKHCLFNACMAVVDDGDEVIIPSPYWLTYPELVRMAGGVPVFVDTKKENGYIMTADEFEAAVTDRTRALILNTPSNPCGAVYSKEQLQAVADVALRHGIIVISDEIYEILSYEGEKPVSIASLSDEIKASTIVINGVSKAYAMTGWRIGYSAAPKECAKAMSSYQSHATSNPNSIAQAASVAALNGPTSEMEKMAEEFKARRNIMCQMINASPRISCDIPKGAFYVMVDITECTGLTSGGKKITGSLDFCAELLDRFDVAAIPGAAFGCDSAVRLSYATSREAIVKGLERLAAFTASLK